MANTSVYFDAPMEDKERRDRLYHGDIFVFSPTPVSRELADLGAAMLEQAFMPHDPRQIHRHLSAEDVATILAKLKPQFIHHPESALQSNSDDFFCSRSPRSIIVARICMPARRFEYIPV